MVGSTQDDKGHIILEAALYGAIHTGTASLSTWLRNLAGKSPGVRTGNRLELLKRDRAGQWSIRINDQWRICFRWVDGDATDVEIADYH